MYDSSVERIKIIFVQFLPIIIIFYQKVSRFPVVGPGTQGPVIACLRATRNFSYSHNIDGTEVTIKSLKRRRIRLAQTPYCSHESHVLDKSR